MPSLSASATQSPSAVNRQAQDGLVGDVAAASGRAQLLASVVDQTQLSVIGLGQQLLDAERQLATVDHQMRVIESDHEQVTARLGADRFALAAMVRRIYTHQSNFLVALIQAGGFAGFLRVVGYSDVVVERERHLYESVQADEVALAHAQTSTGRTLLAEHAVVERLQRTHATLTSQVTLEQRLQVDLQGSIDDALQALGQARLETPAVANERARLVRLRTDNVLRQIEQAVFAEGSHVSLVGLTTQDPLIGAPGRLLWPIPHATISQGFGPSAFSFEPAFAGFPHFHTGIDLAVPLGTPLYASADGVVAESRAMTDADGNLVGYGNYVLLQHDDSLSTLYGHLLGMAVRQGDLVKRGQLIGLVGSSGNSTGPHTHFEVRLEMTPVDPMQFLPDPVGAAITRT